jgi:two-component system, OmpR family, phosphate regulon sensor histidine kinase PhoR
VQNVWLRVLAAATAAGVGALVGVLLGLLVDLPRIGAALGGIVGAVVVAGLEGLRAQRLLKWLQQDFPDEPPPLPGLWGDLAYRAQRALHVRDARIGQEQQRLDGFLSAIEASPNGVMLLDERDEITWLNPVASQHFALDRERDLHQRITNLARAPGFVTWLQAGRFDEPVVFTGPGGRSTLSAVARRYGDGMTLVLSQDITERERADAMRRDFVANVSHEIRTPLTVLSGFVETLDSLPLTEVERKRVLTLMAQQTDRMQALVSDLLTLAQLEGSPRPSADRWNALDELLRRAQTDGQALSNGRHEIVASGGEGLEIAGAPTELLSAVGNLLNNAVRYTPAGGRIGVHWRPRADGGGCVEVVDTGPGIAREHIPRITERFYRIDSSRSRETGGTGLGLSIVKHVVQRHGGEIEVESEAGKGATFRLVFPAARLRQRVAQVPATEPAAL